MKAKFAHLFVRDGFLYGLDDGILAVRGFAGRLATLEGRPATGTDKDCSWVNITY